MEISYGNIAVLQREADKRNKNMNVNGTTEHIRNGQQPLRSTNSYNLCEFLMQNQYMPWFAELVTKPSKQTL